MVERSFFCYMREVMCFELRESNGGALTVAVKSTYG